MSIHLFFTAAAGNTKATNILFHYGANPFNRGFIARTLVDLAKDHQHVYLVQLLEDYASAHNYSDIKHDQEIVLGFNLHIKTKSKQLLNPLQNQTLEYEWKSIAAHHRAFAGEQDFGVTLEDSTGISPGGLIKKES
jgi:hypothetical protein